MGGSVVPLLHYDAMKASSLSRSDDHPCDLCDRACSVDKTKFIPCACWIHRQCVPLMWE